MRVRGYRQSHHGWHVVAVGALLPFLEIGALAAKHDGRRWRQQFFERIEQGIVRVRVCDDGVPSRAQCRLGCAQIVGASGQMAESDENACSNAVVRKIVRFMLWFLTELEYVTT